MKAGKRASGEAGQCVLFEDSLPARLQALGLRQVERIMVHSNRTVMLSLSRRTLRIHQGYAFAPDEVLEAVVRFLNPRAPRAQRRIAEREFLSFPVHAHVPAPEQPRRRERLLPGDIALLRRLRRLHRELNQRHFGGKLGRIPIRISGRMRRRLGELAVDSTTGKAAEMTLSRRHLVRHAWAQVEHTVLHEMVHQWQAEAGLPVDHGPNFRQKAREVGVLPAARRRVD